VASTIENPTFGQPETNCAYSQTAPYTTSTCPVIGNPLEFDIQSISISLAGDTVSATIDFNYGGGQSLAPFMDGGVQLQPGDLFFYSSSDPTQQNQYGVALTSSRPGSQNSFIAGDLYQIGGAISLETAATALGDPDAYYRVTQQVLMVDNAGTPNPAATGNGVNVAALGNGASSAEYAVTVQFSAPTGLVNLFQSGSIGVDFAAADCGNAVLDGSAGGFVTTNASPAPEPEGALLMGLGFGIILVVRYLRKRMSRAVN
jgi:hypothetical protein